LRNISEQLLPNNAVLFNNKMYKIDYSQDSYFRKSGKINEIIKKSTVRIVRTGYKELR